MNAEYTTNLNLLITNTLMKFLGEDVPNIFNPSHGDKRFRDGSWDSNIYFSFIKQFYLMSCDLIHNHVMQLGLEPQMQRMVEFFVKQFTGAFCPSNFALSNPEVFKESMATGWKNIVQGLENFLEDLKSSNGMLNVNTTDKMFFKIGENMPLSGEIVCW